MQKLSFHRGETGWFSEQHLRLVYDQASFNTFLQEPFSKDALLRQIDRKKPQFGVDQRTNLVQALRNQYEGFELSAETKANIEALSNENAFTITTGHQLSLFTGPLYFVIKILHVLKMCESLNAENPDKKFVPVYWMATEDHDFEEIQSAQLFNRSISWETAQKGPVGLFDTDGLDAVRAELHGLFENHPEGEIHQLIDQLNGANYAAAARSLVNHLFANRGLVIIDGDDDLLKASFVPVFQKELESQFSATAVEKLTSEVVAAGGKAQVSARDINLFYSEKGLRSRIIATSAGFHVDGKGDFTLETLMSNPTKISPNVILRPLYQEFILPNLAYIGGGGEIAYWLQLKSVFEEAGVVFPLIQIRNSVIWLDRSTASKLEKIEGNVTDLFQDEDVWKKAYVTENAGDDLDTSALDASFNSFSQELQSFILGLDPSKEQFIQAEISRIEKQVESIKAKGIKFSKTQFDQAMNVISFIKARINPNGGLQERSVNFFQFCTNGEVQSVISQLYDALAPFDGDLIVIIEKD